MVIYSALKINRNTSRKTELILPKILCFNSSQITLHKTREFNWNCPALQMKWRGQSAVLVEPRHLSVLKLARQQLAFSAIIVNNELLELGER